MLFCIHQVNRLHSRNDDSTINIVPVIITVADLLLLLQFAYLSPTFSAHIQRDDIVQPSTGIRRGFGYD